MQDFIEDENNYRFYNDCGHTELINLVATKIVGNLFSNDEIVELLRDSDAEVAHDILKIILQNKFIKEDDYNEIDSKLISIYEAEFVRDVENNSIIERMKFKTNNNKRFISRYELLGIYFSKTLETKFLFGNEESEDRVINLLVKYHKELCMTRNANKLYDLKKQNVGNVINLIISKIKNLKNKGANV